MHRPRFGACIDSADVERSASPWPGRGDSGRSHLLSRGFSRGLFTFVRPVFHFAHGHGDFLWQACCILHSVHQSIELLATDERIDALVDAAIEHAAELCLGHAALCAWSSQG